MSLLMDALRKAEQAKQQETQRGAAEQTPPVSDGGTVEIAAEESLPPDETRQTETMRAGEEATADSENADAYPHTELRLAEEDETAGDFSPPPSGPSLFDLVEGEAAAGPAEIAAEDEVGLDAAPAPPAVAAAPVLLAGKPARPQGGAVPPTSGGTEGIPAEKLKPTAQLLAGQDAETAKPVIRGWLIGILSLVVLGWVAGGGFYLYLEMNSGPAIPAPEPGGLAALIAEQQAKQVTEAAQEDNVNALFPGADNLAAAAPAGQPPAPPLETPPQVETPPQAAAAPPASAPAPARETPRAPPPAIRPAPPVETAPSPGVEIRKARALPQVRKQLADAYQAYQGGQQGRARDLYQAVLARDARNRDALLGLAGLAARAGQAEDARHYYAQVLRLYPQDAVAESALIGLGGEAAAGPPGESRLKSLLAAAPQAAHLHFSLGNLYQRQGRWREAQQAYFEAFRYDNSQADYAYNLAVSLDHLGKTAPALDFYARALQLAEARASHFDPQAVLRRMQSLQVN